MWLMLYVPIPPGSTCSTEGGGGTEGGGPGGAGGGGLSRDDDISLVASSLAPVFPRKSWVFRKLSAGQERTTTEIRL